MINPSIRFVAPLVWLVSVAALPLQAATGTWINSTATAGSPGLWSTGANWSGGVPAAGAGINVFRGTSSPAYVLLNSTTNALGATTVDYGTVLTIGATGELIINGSSSVNGRLDIQATGGTGTTVNVLSGGKITLVNSGGSNLRFNVNAGATLNTAGDISQNLMNVYGTVNVTGGTVALLPGQTVTVAGGTFNQSGGTVGVLASGVSTISALQLSGGGIYTISGGTLNTAGSTQGLWFQAQASGRGSTFSVVGSAASINLGSYRNGYDATTAPVKPTFAFTLDNTANHISTINFAVNGNGGTTLRTNANLSVSLAGGVLLSGTNTFPIIQRGTGASDAAWAATGLWKDVTVAKATIQIGFNGSTKGLLDVLGTTPLTFSPASLGFINLTNTGSLTSMQLGLDVTGGTLSNFTDALTGSGIGWTAGVGAYDVIITLNPSVSGGSYFAWDFTNIDAAMQLQGISAIPEPASFVMLAGLGVLGFVSLRRRHRSRA